MDETDLAQGDVPTETTAAPDADDGAGEDRPTPETGEAPSGDASGDPTRQLVEAALFSAGDPIRPADIADVTGLDPEEVHEALDALVDAYGERATALEVARAGEKYAMQIRADLTTTARDFAPMEIPRHMLRTLALVAYHQPLKQSDLVDMVGSKAYDHVRELEELGMIDAEPHGLTKMLGTSETFPEYFGIDATDAEEIREFLGREVGLKAVQEPGGLEPDGGPPPDEIGDAMLP